MNTVKPRYDSIRALSISKTAKAFHVTNDYVRKIVRGDMISKEILAYYETAHAQLKALMEI